MRLVGPHDNETMLSPLRPGGSTLWSIVCALMLVLKAGIPVLAATAAFMQGKPVAEICAIYGVRTSVQAGSATASEAHGGHDALAKPVAHAGRDAQAGHDAGAGRHVHAGNHTHGGHADDTRIAAVGSAPEPTSPHDSVQGREHCALTGLAVCAASAVARLEAMAWPGSLRISRSLAKPLLPVHDASARWLSERIHAPPFAA
jgi:hypothetical protein